MESVGCSQYTYDGHPAIERSSHNRRQIESHTRIGHSTNKHRWAIEPLSRRYIIEQQQQINRPLIEAGIA